MCVAEWNISTFRYLLYNSASFLISCFCFPVDWRWNYNNSYGASHSSQPVKAELIWYSCAGTNCNLPQAPEFPEFNVKVQEAINVLGGCVFPKLNWSAPRVSRFDSQLFIIHMNVQYSHFSISFCLPSQDANWIALNSSLQCQSLSDIFLLFKSSDFITHDLTQP